MMEHGKRERLRRSFRPDHVELLFIGESPPASGRFFYARDSGLYRAMRDAFQAVDASIDDDHFLGVFKAANCYLIDLCPEPVDHLETKLRRAARLAGEEGLSRELRRLQPAMLAPVLRSIEANVGRAASRVDFRGRILSLPYPGRWSRHRAAFVAALAPVLAKLLDSFERE